MQTSVLVLGALSKCACYGFESHRLHERLVIVEASVTACGLIPRKRNALEVHVEEHVLGKDEAVGSNPIKSSNGLKCVPEMESVTPSNRHQLWVATLIAQRTGLLIRAMSVRV